MLLMQQIKKQQQKAALQEKMIIKNLYQVSLTQWKSLGSSANERSCFYTAHKVVAAQVASERDPFCNTSS